MSAEELVTIYLRCDGELRPGVPCFVTFGRGDEYRNTDDELDLLVRRARQKGWDVSVDNQGMKGSYVAALCPAHFADDECEKHPTAGHRDDRLLNEGTQQ